jgi:hypothetical protein
VEWVRAHCPEVHCDWHLQLRTSCRCVEVFGIEGAETQIKTKETGHGNPRCTLGGWRSGGLWFEASLDKVGTVVHACNPSYRGGIGRWIAVLHKMCETLA